ncbi:hypothetical protein ABGB19_18925 [Mycobacterium sp. B14F4]|uniref:hypothetical protein n=1 Tax=Mycobacterium sp. B14F4 TaxID=3153565 RepID=UPI00325ED141
MALGNGAGGPPAGDAVRTPGSSDDTPDAPDSLMHAKYTVDNDKQIVVLELSYNGFTSTYALPQQLFKEKFLPAAIAAGDLAADDKQVGQVNDFMWRGTLFDDRLFTDLDDYSKWLNTEADKADPRDQQWRCLEAIARARLQSCVTSGSEKNDPGTAWNVGIGYPNDAIPQCDVSDPQTAAVIAGARKTALGV